MNREGKERAKKIAAAISVLNFLNAACADVPDGKLAEHIASYRTAYAGSATTVPNGDTATETRATMEAGDTQTVKNGGTGIVTTMYGGFQYVSGGILLQV